MPPISKLYTVGKNRNEVFSAEYIQLTNKLASNSCWNLNAIRKRKNIKQNKNTYMYIYFAFSECPGPHQLKFVQFFSTQPLTSYFTLQPYIALTYIPQIYFSWVPKTLLSKAKVTFKTTTLTPWCICPTTFCAPPGKFKAESPCLGQK